MLLCTERVSNWRFSALNEYSTLVDDLWTPCLTYMYPIFHVRMSTSERRSVNHNLNLIKVVTLPQCIENHHRRPTSQYWANTTNLMRFEWGNEEYSCQVILLKTFSLKSYAILIRGELLFCCVYIKNTPENMY